MPDAVVIAVDACAFGDDGVIRIGPAINVVKRAGFTPIVVYWGQNYNEVGWSALILASAFSPAPNIRGDLRRWRVRTINDLFLLKQDPVAGTRRPPGSQVYIYVHTTQGSR